LVLEEAEAPADDVGAEVAVATAVIGPGAGVGVAEDVAHALSSTHMTASAVSREIRM
jgi:hypothetical protein